MKQKQKLLRLKDTRGNFSLAIRIPQTGYESGYNRLKAAVQQLREEETRRQYYKRDYVIAKRRTRKARAAKKEYDRIRNARPGMKQRRRELQRRNRAKKKALVNLSTKNNTKSIKSRGKNVHK